ncbi:MAG: immunity 8 family protein [Myxococcales bacterium]|nr:immunity 8 family protein [Myxococcales bacterium]
MGLEIKKLAAFDCDLEGWQPESASDAWLDVTMGIGVVGEDGLNWFNVTVASTVAAAARGESESRKGLLVSPRVADGDSIRELLHEVVQQCVGLNWDASVNHLCQRFDWEYENYQPDA